MKCQNCEKEFYKYDTDVYHGVIVRICPYCKHGNY